MKVILVFGTRPEAIKMCPLVLELKKNKEIECKVCLTGQHREMLRQVMEAFHIVEDYNLDIMKARQTLTTITADVLEGLAPILNEEHPDLVLVHGDTTTSFAAALAAFYQMIPVGHVEAGLRTGNIYSPYPEEMNRLLTGRIASYHFAPTIRNKQNLEREGIIKNVYVTGNTVIDAFQTTIKADYQFSIECLNYIDFEMHRIITLTAHRRENLGQPLEHICRAVLRIVNEYEDVEVVYPVHLNPAVQNTAHSILGGIDRIHLIEPVDVLDMHNLMRRSYLIMTDSGGLQEEAPTLGKPVIVLRTETERPEAVEAGTVRVAGVREEDIYRCASELLSDKTAYEAMARAVNPYGDGHACERIVEVIMRIGMV